MDLEAISEPDAGRVSDELRELGLHYTTDEVRGITRRRAGKGFSYRAPDGSLLKNADTLGMDPQAGGPAGVARGLDLAHSPRPSARHRP